MCGGMKITALEEFADFATLDTKNLFSKLKCHELCRKGRPNHDAFLTSKPLITCARAGGHDANPTNTVSSSLEFALSSLAAACTSSAKGGGDHPRTILSAATPPTSSPAAPSRRSLTPPTSMTAPTGTTTARTTTRRRTISETGRSPRRSCPECVLL
jgi:hypothetical protein